MIIHIIKKSFLESWYKVKTNCCEDNLNQDLTRKSYSVSALCLLWNNAYTNKTSMIYSWGFHESQPLLTACPMDCKQYIYIYNMLEVHVQANIVILTCQGQHQVSFPNCGNSSTYHSGNIPCIASFLLLVHISRFACPIQYNWHLPVSVTSSTYLPRPQSSTIGQTTIALGIFLALPHCPTFLMILSGLKNSIAWKVDRVVEEC